MSAFPNIQAMGLQVRDIMRSPCQPMQVDAIELESLLASALLVFARKVEKTDDWLYFDSEPEPGIDTHTFRAVCFQQVRRDTADELVRALADRPLRGDANDELIFRARKLVSP